MNPSSSREWPPLPTSRGAVRDAILDFMEVRRYQDASELAQIVTMPGRQPPAASRQPPAASRQPPAASHQPPAASRQPPAASRQSHAARPPLAQLIADTTPRAPHAATSPSGGSPTTTDSIDSTGQHRTSTNISERQRTTANDSERQRTTRLPTPDRTMRVSTSSSIIAAIQAAIRGPSVRGSPYIIKPQGRRRRLRRRSAGGRGLRPLCGAVTRATVDLGSSDGIHPDDTGGGLGTESVLCGGQRASRPAAGRPSQLDCETCTGLEARPSRVRSAGLRTYALVALYSCQASGMPLRTWMPRSSKVIPEPITKSLTVVETRTSPG